MNRLDPPGYADDNAALDALAINHRLKSFPHLQEHVVTIKAGYAQYLAANGNLQVINKVPLPEQIETYLKDLYASPSQDIAYIDRIREESDANCCPMCGSFHSGTLDHMAPKVDYPVFAIFGRNLVPACKCNSKRTAELFCLNSGGRILHPYFDDVLSDRILAANIEDFGLVPRISLKVVLDPAHPLFASAQFHLENVVERTSVLRHLRTSWQNLLRRPSLIARDLKNTPGSRAALETILIEELDRQDDAIGSRNNWMSIFVAGLLEAPVLDWLSAAFSQAGREPDSPLVADII